MTAVSSCLHERFERHVAAAPDAPAITFDGETLSYAALNIRANRLAHHLRACGVGPDVLVALCLDRGFDTVVAILAVLKAGGAYVPIDPAHPSERVRTIVEDAACPVVLVHTAHAAPFGGAGAQLIALDAPDPPWAHGPDTNPPPEATPENLVYVMYTSGSTGKPKGVLITHSNIVHAMEAMRHWFTLDASDVWTLFHSYAFDFSVWECWGALYHGGRLVVVPIEVARSPAAYHQLLVDEGVTILNQTPSAFGQLQRYDETLPRAVSGRLAIREVLIGGETVNLPGLASWFDRHGDTRPRLNVAYGVTETTIFITCRPLSRADTAPGTPNYIGTPLPGWTTRVVDEAGHEVGTGAAGELLVGGPGVGRGYLRRPELTAERFVPDPHDHSGTGRVYKTGDLVRVCDGDLEFIGRNDLQVQLRGFRVELGEIEAALRGHPAVRGAVVRVREDFPGGQRLVAYYLASAPLPARVLRGHMEATLPPYMLPSAIVHLEAFPLNTSGKIDVSALPAPGGGPADNADFVAPRNARERELADLWQTLLGVDPVGIHDDFLAAGGHSLLATTLASRIQERFQVQLPVSVLFNAPTIAQLADAIDSAADADEVSDAPVRAPRDEAIPLSFAQEQLWILDQLHPGMTAYNIAIRVDLHGALEHSTLEAALESVVRRHEILRTVFVARDGVPEQRILPEMPVPLERIALGETAAPDREARFMGRVQELERQPMDLATGPLLRAAIAEFAPEYHRLVLIVHHTVFDGWSLRVFLDELTAFMDSIRRGDPDDRPPLEFQYADYAAWQRARSRRPAFQTQLDYWRKKLAGPLPVLEVPGDFARPAVQSWDGAGAHRQLRPALRQGIEALAQRERVTPFVVLLAAWKALLYRYTGQEDCIVGSAIAGRSRVEWEPLIGFFINTVALRTTVPRDRPFASLIQRVHETALEAHEHQETPFEHVVAAVQRDRDPGRPPVVQVAFVLHNTPRYEAECTDLAMAAREVTSTSAKFDLLLAVQPADDGFSLRMEYATALYRRETADQMLVRYEALLEQAIAQPEQPIGRVQLAARDVKEVAAPRAGAASATGACLHEVFERHSAGIPEAPAVTCEGTTLSYRELNARANRLAHYLRDLGVGPDVLVGLCLDRSIDTVVAILAVLKAGGAYVPMDPVYPAERVRMIVDDADCAIVIAHVAQAADFEGSRAKVVVLDALETPWTACPETNPPHETTRENLAYVIYTSGSTGRPKGALITHHNVCRLITEMKPWFDIGPDDVWTLFHSYAFDFSVWEMWGAYFHGGRLVVVPHLVSRSPELFYQLLLNERVTVLNQTPSAFRQLQLHDETAPMAAVRKLALRYVIFGGEILDLPGLKPWFDRHGDQCPRLVNMYGITETTVFVTYRPVSRADTTPGTPNYIGIPIPDLTLYILDENGRPVDTGEAGELYVGGPGVGRGYLRRPELTAERFVPDPLGGGKQESFYKTGDLVRVHDGDLEFLGRNDMQVQIRGFRVEIGEIETALNSHPSVRGAAVRMREDVAGDQRLVAYYLAREALPVSSLREHLSATLPPYMIPAAFERLDAFPLNNNGKLDVDALPAPGAAVASDAGAAAPKTDTEKKLAELWCELLRIPSAGADDNFFALGGHSLLAIQLLAKVNDTFGTGLTLADFFETPTVRGLAARIDAGEAPEGPVQERENELLEIKPGTGTPFFCVKGAGDVGGSYETFAKALAPDQPFYGFPDVHQEEGAPATVEHLAKRCIEEIVKVRPHGPYYVGGYSFGGIVAYEIARQLLAAGEAVPLIAMLDSAVPDHDKVERGYTRAYMGRLARKVRVKCTMLSYTWKLVLGYLRDLCVVMARRLVRRPGREENAPGWREYLGWIRLDLTVQYYLIQAGLVESRIGGRRLRMLEESTVRESARSMVASETAMAHYRLVPIPARITLFRAEHSPGHDERRDPAFGWDRYAEKGVEVVEVPGNHMVIIRHPYAVGLGQALQRVIDQLEQDQDSPRD